MQWHKISAGKQSTSTFDWQFGLIDAVTYNHGSGGCSTVFWLGTRSITFILISEENCSDAVQILMNHNWVIDISRFYATQYDHSHCLQRSRPLSLRRLSAQAGARKLNNFQKLLWFDRRQMRVLQERIEQGMWVSCMTVDFLTECIGPPNCIVFTMECGIIYKVWNT